MKTLAQKRAEFALNKVTELSINKDDFKSFAAGAPAMILQNGLGQSLSFWMAKGKDKHLALFEIVRNWLVTNQFIKGENKQAFLQALFNMPQRDYLFIQNETLAILEWIKRFAAAKL